MKIVIFELDLTLVNTIYLEQYRRTRNRPLAYRLIIQTFMYQRMREVLDIIDKYNIRTTIVSTAPWSYIEKPIAYYTILNISDTLRHQTQV